MATRKKQASKSNDVEINVPGTSFISDKTGVHGTPSKTDRKGARGAYAASSVIQRGTANKIRSDMGNDAERAPCICGCGQTPSQADSLFMPGHDSKVRSMGKALLEKKVSRKDLPKPVLEYLDAGGMLAHS